MRVLLLSPYENPVIDESVRALGDDVTLLGDDLSSSAERVEDFDWIVSYGYKFIIRDAVLRKVCGRAVNLHISVLPWNRGMHPNIWSFVDGTPTGVSIHYVDSGIDTGDIIAQRAVPIDDSATLKTSYELLRRNVEELFADCWPSVRSGCSPRRPQPEGGSHHFARELETIQHLMPLGWDTPVSFLRNASLAGQTRRKS